MLRRFVLPALLLAVTGCAARTPPRPAGAPLSDSSAVAAFETATALCKGFRSIEGELALSGRAGGERVRGRVLTGLESGGAVRLEGVAPFGAPFFILAGRAERATLVLPRERRVLRDTAVSAVLERLTGLALGADDLRLIVSGCLVDQATPGDGRRWPGSDWQAVTLAPERVAYLRTQQGRPVVVAADYGPWHIDYSGHQGGYPRVVRVRSARASADPAGAVDITARVEQLNVNTAINPLAWRVDIPSDADPMTLDELRSIAPLAERK